MFIQQQCGCIGLLIESKTTGSKIFFKIIDCRDTREDLGLYDDTDSMEYRRYRQLNDEEADAIIQLLNVQLADGDRYEAVQQSLGIKESDSHARRSKARINWNKICTEHRTFKDYSDRELINRFPHDQRNQDEIDKEIAWLKRIDEFEKNNQ